MWENYDDVLGQIRDGGLLVEEPLLVGTARPGRCLVADDPSREERGWYWLNEIVLPLDEGGTGRFLVGAYGINRGNDHGTVKLALRQSGKIVRLSAEQRAARDQQIKEQQRRLDAMRKAIAERAAARATAAWHKYVPTGQSSYLASKGVGAFGIRFSPSGNGTFAVPMTDPHGKVWGLEIIRDPNRSGRAKRKLDKQYWPKGLDKIGHYHMIGGLPRGIIFVAEGYATGASLHMASGYCVAVAFDAGNLLPVCRALKKAYPQCRILIGADDDYRTEGNPGVTAASTAALAVGGAFLAPSFAMDREMDRSKPKGPTDWNDMHQLAGEHAVRSQIEVKLAELGWLDEVMRGQGGAQSKGSGDSDAMPSRLTLDEAVRRYWGTYGLGGKVFFDEVERRLVTKEDALNLLYRHGYDDLRAHPDWRVARDREIDFDPTQKDPKVRCNFYGGWPTVPQKGECHRTLELLEYLCNHEGSQDVFSFVLRWLAYPIQNPGAKMHSALVVHGPQGTGKSMIFGAIREIYGPYGYLLNQDALDDKFNGDWAEKRLFVVADEVVASCDVYQIKNRLKTFITGEIIRVNPKMITAHAERNCMNIVFLANGIMPVALEGDDRRHGVIWTPPALDEGVYVEVGEELRNGGVAALHHYLRSVDLSGFHPWTRPPMTEAKQELIGLGLSSEERFVRAWTRLEVENRDGEVLPLCPCLGMTLYKAYERYCRQHGELRPRGAHQFINYVGKRPGWSAGRPEWTWHTFSDQRRKQRKLVVPSEADMQDALRLSDGSSSQSEWLQQPEEPRIRWLTRCFFAFESAAFQEG